MILFVAAIPAQTARADGAELKRRGMALEAEIKLAREKAVYAVCDLGEGAVLIKARGVTLKKLAIAESSLYGEVPPIVPLKLIERTVEPERESIEPEKVEDEPAKQEEAAEPEEPAPKQPDFDIKALEVRDMPSSYRLRLAASGKSPGQEGGVVISVSPDTGSFGSRARAVFMKVGWEMARLWGALKHAFGGAAYSEVDISLAEADAKALYWHLGEGTAVIVIAPGEK